MERPKRLLIFINPVGGKKLAGKIYKEKVQPLFDLANIKTEIIGIYGIKSTMIISDIKCTLRFGKSIP